MSDINNNDPLLKRREVCARGRFGSKTLQRLERQGEGPPRIEITSGLSVYRQSKFDQWLEARTVTGAKASGRVPTAATEAKRKGGAVR
jgi:predicted DNA-binding transcriptional regulator AlpA